MDDLLEEYRETLELTKAAHVKAREEDPGYNQGLWYKWVGELNYIVNWLEIGEEPKRRKSREVGFKKEETFERVGSVCLFNPYAPNPYEEVDKKIDKERGADRLD